MKHLTRLFCLIQFNNTKCLKIRSQKKVLNGNELMIFHTYSHNRDELFGKLKKKTHHEQEQNNEVIILM